MASPVTPDYSVFPHGFSPEPLLSPSPPTALHMLTQTSAGGGASRAHSRESNAQPSPARHEGTLSPRVLTQSQTPAPLVKTPSATQTLAQSVGPSKRNFTRTLILQVIPLLSLISTKFFSSFSNGQKCPRFFD